MSSSVSGARDGILCAKSHSGRLVTTQSRKIRSSRREAESTDRNRPPRVSMCRQLSKVASFESATYAALRIMPTMPVNLQVRAVSAVVCAA